MSLSVHFACDVPAWFHDHRRIYQFKIVRGLSNMHDAIARCFTAAFCTRSIWAVARRRELSSTSALASLHHLSPAWILRTWKGKR